MAETAYVHKSFHEAPRAYVADSPVIRWAMKVYETDRLDFAEAYLVACAESTGVGTVVSFDRLIDRVPSVRWVEP